MCTYLTNTAGWDPHVDRWVMKRWMTHPSGQDVECLNQLHIVLSCILRYSQIRCDLWLTWVKRTHTYWVKIHSGHLRRLWNWAGVFPRLCVWWCTMLLFRPSADGLQSQVWIWVFHFNSFISSFVSTLAEVRQPLFISTSQEAAVVLHLFPF